MKPYLLFFSMLLISTQEEVRGQHEGPGLRCYNMRNVESEVESINTNKTSIKACSPEETTCLRVSAGLDVDSQPLPHGPKVIVGGCSTPENCGLDHCEQLKSVMPDIEDINLIITECRVTCCTDHLCNDVHGRGKETTGFSPPTTNYSTVPPLVQTMVPDITKQLMAATKQECPQSTVDLLFVLDGSGSVSGNFGIIKRWVKNIMEKMKSQMAADCIEVGVVQYSHYYKYKPWAEQEFMKTEIEIGEFSSYDKFAQAVDAIRLHGYTTFTGRALEKVVADFQRSSRFTSKRNTQMMFLMTDGKSNDPQDVKRNADALRSLGVKTYAIGVNDVDIRELRIIATGDETSYKRVYSLTEFIQLDSLVEILLEKINLVLEDPCTNNPCRNGTTCQLNDDKTGHVCLCDIGFKGDDCEELDVRISRIDDPTGPVVLRCICPTAVLTEILWTQNRLEVDRRSYFADSWAEISVGGRRLTITNPYYTHSGNYTCQFQYQGTEYRASALVIIKASNSEACGESVGLEDPERTGKGQRIFGGRITNQYHAPFMAMFYKKYPTRPASIFCGGSIVDTKHIITAAVCFSVSDLWYENVTVYVGKHIANTSRTERLQQSAEIESVTIHPSYDKRTYNGDIAIVTLKQEIYYSEGVKPICILDPNEEDEDLKPKAAKGSKEKIGIVYGWGLTEKNEHSILLKEVDLFIWKNSVCSSAHPGRDISPMMFCAGSDKRGRDACQGDAGGPFTLWSGKRMKWFLAGIVSWGPECGRPEKPGVYARITPDVRQWIYNNTNLGA